MGGTAQAAWHQVAEVERIASPALLLYTERVEANVRRMIEIAGGPARLRPHVKTHKLAEVVQMQQEHGITKFKCATIAEAEMLGECAVGEALLAYQPVGPNVARLAELARRFPATRFAAVVDNTRSAREISSAALAAGVTVELLLDVDCGMGRTGIVPGPEAEAVYAVLAALPAVAPGGLHAYDGHRHESDPAVRAALVRSSFEPVQALRNELRRRGLPVPRLVAGGTPSFPIHARDGDRSTECSPGTCVLSDGEYAKAYPDLDFPPAALVLTRVISKPGSGRLCLDLGHKAIAAESPHPRVTLLELPDAVPLMHHEEHLVLQTPRADEFAVGDALYGIPRHICPTVALYGTAEVIRAGRRIGGWQVRARNRRLSI